MNVQVASQQPSTNGKVILYTSHGEIDIQLWSKQTPLACRNFIQHAMQGYYNNTIFHRVIPNFMIQGGDPTGTGLGGQSIYPSKTFKDQFHQRLKFSRRGIVAMANVGKDSNGSQFFMTFGPCEHLNKKHTIFGKVVGDTIYNLMGMQSLDTDQKDKPLDPPVIRKIKIVNNPFPDITIEPQIKQINLKQETSKQSNNIASKKKDLKNLKNKNKLTFAQQQQQNQQQTSKQSRTRIISSHDALYKKDASLSNKVSITKQELQKKRKQRQLQQKKAEQLKQKLLLNKNEQQEQMNLNENLNVNDIIAKEINKKRAQFQKVSKVSHYKGQDQILNYQKRYNPVTKKYDIVFKDQLDKQKTQKQKQQQLQRKAREQQQITDEKLKQVRELQMRQYSLLKADQLNFKKAKEGSMKQRRKELIHQEKKLLSNLEKHRYEFTKKQKQQALEGELFGKLMGFANRLKGVKSSQNNQKQQDKSNTSKQVLKSSWMSHQLKFHIDSSNAYSLEQKGMRHNMNKNFEQDDGGLKMEIQYNNPLQQQGQQNENF